MMDSKILSILISLNTAVGSRYQEENNLVL